MVEHTTTEVISLALKEEAVVAAYMAMESVSPAAADVLVRVLGQRMARLLMIWNYRRREGRADGAAHQNLNHHHSVVGPLRPVR